jgi:hypothetical protein
MPNLDVKKDMKVEGELFGKRKSISRRGGVMREESKDQHMLYTYMKMAQ